MWVRRGCGVEGGMLGGSCLGLVYDNNIVNRIYIGDGARVLFRVSWCCACIIVCITNRNPQSRLNIVVV